MRAEPSYPPGFTPMLRADMFVSMLDMRRMPRGVSFRQANFLTLLAVRPSLTRADYQALSHISANTAQQDIAELLQAGLILRRGAGLSSRYCLVAVFEHIPPQPPRYHKRVAPESPSDRDAIAEASPSNPSDIPTESPQSELDSALAFILRCLSASTLGGRDMADTDAMKDKIQGKLHEVKGAATGDKGEEVKGKLQGAKGDVEHNVNKAQREDVRDEARDEARREVDRRTP